MTQFIVGALAFAAMTGIAFVQPAEARCFLNGHRIACAHHPALMHRAIPWKRSDLPRWLKR